ncbi:hypothetical protein KP509_12G011800 [Ceratopteris richardii]|uniref:Uncharacterized protein n=1 Tax=Ceratopteris richardii TaxID=49495 RepID=A0A8T2TGM7_CERRI|nr:hypothetical protein KP509_12G011800 [Ceratopteris richardii]
MVIAGCIRNMALEYLILIRLLPQTNGGDGVTYYLDGLCSNERHPAASYAGQR